MDKPRIPTATTKPAAGDAFRETLNASAKADKARCNSYGQRMRNR